MPFARRIKGEIIVDRHAMCVERTLMVGDGIRVTAMVNYIVDRYGIFAGDASSLAGLWEFPDVIMTLVLGFSLYIQAAYVQNIRVIYQCPVRIVIVVV